MTAFEQWCTLNPHTLKCSREAAEPVLTASNTAQLQLLIRTDLAITLRLKVNKSSEVESYSSLSIMFGVCSSHRSMATVFTHTVKEG